MKILVTGATGFLGARVVEKLYFETDHEVTVSFQKPAQQAGTGKAAVGDDDGP